MTARKLALHVRRGFDVGMSALTVGCVGALALACGVAVATAGRWYVFELTLPLASLALTTVVTIVVAARRGDVLSPLVLSAVFYALAYVGGSIYFWINPDLETGIFFSRHIGHTELTRA